MYGRYIGGFFSGAITLQAKNWWIGTRPLVPRRPLVPKSGPDFLEMIWIRQSKRFGQHVSTNWIVCWRLLEVSDLFILSMILLFPNCLLWLLLSSAGRRLLQLQSCHKSLRCPKNDRGTGVQMVLFSRGSGWWLAFNPLRSYWFCDCWVFWWYDVSGSFVCAILALKSPFSGCTLPPLNEHNHKKKPRL